MVRIDESWFTVDPAAAPDYAALLALPGFHDPDDMVRVVFSSGTTGYPKAVKTTLGVFEASCAHAELTEAGPHTHAFRAVNMLGFSTSATLMALLLVLSRGGLIIYGNRPDEVLRLIRAFQAEIVVGAVVQLQGLLAALGDGPPPASLKTIVAAGSRIPRPLLNEVRARLCPNLNVGYGSTEAGPISFGTGPQLDRHDGSAGYVLPWVQLQTVDANDQPVPPGTDGIVRLKTGEQSTYLVPTPETDAMFRDGWFYPGDVARLFADGLVAITGRVTEIINRGGVIVAPEMVEDVLRTLPGVKDVAVVGVPDKDGIEEIWAAIVSDSWVDAHAVRQAALVRLPDRAPDRVVQIEAIPRNENGKVTRKALREQLSRTAG